MARALVDFFHATALARRLQPASIGDCGVCHKPITDEHPDDVRFIGEEGAKQPVHEDCFFDELGNIVEQHPIFNPTR